MAFCLLLMDSDITHWDILLYKPHWNEPLVSFISMGLAKENFPEDYTYGDGLFIVILNKKDNMTKRTERS